MSSLSATRAALLAGAVLMASSCTNFQTSFATPVDPAVSSGWSLADLTVTVPASLKVSEARSIFPIGDIVWREDPAGDRYSQVAALLDAAATDGADELSGNRPINILLTVSRFHALTFEAERRLTRSGVHDIEFTAEVRDAATGELLKGPDFIEASLPALSGNEMIEARLRGETQASQISAHVAAVIAGWLGLGPDPRGTFRRLGG